MIKSIFPPRRICCLSTFSFTWLKSQIVTKQRLRFVLIILWGWECTLSAPGLFLCRSEVLPQHTKTLLPFGWGVLALAKHLLLLQMSNCLSLLTFNICLTITEAFCSAGLFTCTCPLIFFVPVHSLVAILVCPLILLPVSCFQPQPLSLEEAATLVFYQKAVNQSQFGQRFFFFWISCPFLTCR